MWIILNDAFLSVVDFDPKKDPHKRSNDDRQLLLCRARRREDLERSFERVGITAEIMDRAGADYSYGAIITRTDLKELLAAQVDDIDYTNFKNSVKENDRHSVYSACWTALVRLQARAPWSGKASRYGTGFGTGLSGYDQPTLGSILDDRDTVRDLDTFPRPRLGEGSATRYGYDMDDIDLEPVFSDASAQAVSNRREEILAELPGATGYKTHEGAENRAFNAGMQQGYEAGAMDALDYAESEIDSGTLRDEAFEEGFQAGETHGLQIGQRLGFERAEREQAERKRTSRDGKAQSKPTSKAGGKTTTKTRAQARPGSAPKRQSAPAARRNG